jgi:hypothetical protein
VQCKDVSDWLILLLGIVLADERAAFILVFWHIGVSLFEQCAMTAMHARMQLICMIENHDEGS